MNDRDRILPRFWSIRDKEYIYWDCYMQTAFNRLIEPNTYGLMYKLYKDRVNYIPEMSTGLKDKNGKLIYDGDLIKIDDDVAEIKWSNYSARFILESLEDIFDFETTYAEECEVIGNIHQNNDLIKVGGK